MRTLGLRCSEGTEGVLVTGVSDALSSSSIGIDRVPIDKEGSVEVALDCAVPFVLM
jgi:hypothetical protein